MNTLLQPLQDALSTFFNYLPQLVAAIIILIVGYIVAKILQAIVRRVLQSIGFEGYLERGGIKQFFDRAQTRQTPTSIVGKVVFWLVFIVALTMAADALGIQQLSAGLGQLIAFIPSIIVAILILVLATLLGNFLSGIVRGATGSGILASVVQYAILVYAVFAALTELGIAVELTAPTFLIVLGAVALAGALAFGIGGREVARDIVEKAYERRQEATGGSAAGQQRSAARDEEGGRPEAHRLQRNE